MTAARRRIAVAGAPFAGLSALSAGTIVARAFSRHADVALIPVAGSGPSLGQAVADLRGGAIESSGTGWLARGDDWLAAGVAAEPQPDPWWAGTSSSLGDLVAAGLDQGPVAEVILDLTQGVGADGGAGLLAALGGTADVPLDGGAGALTGLSTVDLGGVHRRLGAASVVGVVRGDQRAAALLGIPGVAARLGQDQVVDRAMTLRLDAALAALADAVAPAFAITPGAGAAGGVGLAVGALGGQLLTGVDLIARDARLVATLRRADALITVTDSFDFHSRGGDVVVELARISAEAERPLVVLTSELAISGREMRTLGVESAHPIELSDDPAASLAEAAARVAAGWIH